MPSRAESYTRNSEGHRCRWKRLLGNYYNGKGIVPVEPNIHLLVGGVLHKCLETVLRTGAPVDQAEATKLLDPIVAKHRETVTRSIPSDRPSENGDESAALVDTLAHAWIRITYPWVLENFEILSIESMEKMEHESVVFRAKPDFIARNKATGVLSVHDFKSASYWDDKSSEQWHFNIQMYLTAFLTQMRMKEPVAEYYIHPLVKGNLKYPSPLVFPWIAPAVTPLGKPSFSLKWKKGFVRGYAFHHKTPADFVWSIPANQIAKFVPVAGPFGTDEEIAKDFIDGAVTENNWWFERLSKIEDPTFSYDGVTTGWNQWADPRFQQHLVKTFPRSYACWDFKRLCEYHRLCFRRKGWEDPHSFGYKTKSYT